MPKSRPFDDPRLFGLDPGILKAIEYDQAFSKQAELQRLIDTLAPARLDPAMFSGGKAIEAIQEAVGASALIGAHSTEVFDAIVGATSLTRQAADLISAGPVGAFAEIQSAAAGALELTHVASGLLKDLDVGKLGFPLGLQERHQQVLASGLFRMSRSYERLYDSFHESERALTPTIVLDRPPREFFEHTRVLHAISGTPGPPPSSPTKEITSPWAEDLGEIDLEECLSELGTGLRDMWAGAGAALDSDNPDRVRHALSSLRELFRLVLLRLAPDADIRTWSQSPNHFHEGSPTRAARIHFVARRVDNGAFGRFLRADVASAVQLFDVLNAGVHGAVETLSEEQARLVRSRAGHLLRFLFEAVRTDGAISNDRAGN
jgi:hypothetical protein